MGASAYVGRVGRLAVALGVGTAVLTGHGIATADETDGAPSNSATSEPAGAQPAEAATAPASTEPSSSDTTSSGGEEAAQKPPQSGVVSAQTNTGTTGSTAPTEPDAEVGTGPEVETDVVTEPEPDAEAPDTEEPAQPVAAEPSTAPKGSTAPKDSKHPAVAEAEKSAAPAVSEATVQAPDEATSARTAAESPAQDSEPEAPAPMTEAVSALSVTSAASATQQDITALAAAAIPVPPAPNPFSIVTNFVSNVVNMVLAPFAGGPAAPANPPMAWTLLAYARREIENFVNAVAGRPVTAAAPESMSLALAAARAVANVPGFPLAGAQLSPSTSFVNWVTGGYQVLGPDGQTINPYIADTLNRFGVSGTDIGVMWDNGIADNPLTDYNEHQVLMAFGDTFGLRNVPGEDWRFNVLMRSADTYLADGMDVPDGEFGNGNWFGGMPLWDVPNGRPYENYARRIINPEDLPPGATRGITLIPTAGIALPTTDVGAIGGMKQYLSFMSVTQWGNAGQWTTNFSGIAYSIDNGENWKIAPSSIRYNDPWSGNANFQQAAFVKGTDGYVYAYGTPNGRQGAAYLSRVLEKDILDVTKYEYYSKGSAGGWFGWGATPAGWYKNQPAKATAQFGAPEQGACGAVNPGVQVSEMSVQYNKQLKKYVALYGDQFNNIVMRTSDTPQGTWSAAKVLMNQQQGGIYAPMMHPWSPSTLGTGSELYWNLSIWSEYNVMLMKTDLSKV